MASVAHTALAPHALQHVLMTCARTSRAPSRVFSGRCHGAFRAARMVWLGTAASLMSMTLTSSHRCASSSGLSKDNTSSSPPLPAPPSSAVPLDTATHLLEDCTVESSTPCWVSTRKPNGEQRMSISIRSTSQRQLARRQSLTASSSSAPLSRTALSRASHPDSAVDATPEPAALTQASEKQEPTLATALAGAHSSSCAAASRMFFTSSNQGCSQGKNIHNTSSLMPTPTLSASSASSKEAAAPSLPPSVQSSSSTAGTPRDADGAAPESLHDASVSTAFSSAAEPSEAANSQETGASHSLLYSVSRFTEPVKRIILIRNGRSEANEDVSTYVQTPDWRIPLVEEGKREAIAAGRALSELIGDDPVYFYYSPYIRSRQSLRYVLQGFDAARLSGLSHSQEWWEEESAGIVSAAGAEEPLMPNSATTPANEAGILPALAMTSSSTSTNVTFPDTPCCLHRDPSLVLNSGTSNNIIGVREDVRLRDGDIGRYTSVDELMHHLVERERYGRFFYRFPFGESGADVCDRITSFLDAFQRERVEFPMDTNVVIITHGLTMRMFIKRWFYLTVDTFHKMKSPPPGSLCTLTRLHHRSCFRLDECCVESMNLPLSLNEFNGYKYRNKQLLGSMSSGAPYM